MYLKENRKNTKYLIVNADDFGLTKGINQGIVKAFREGVVTSASLLSVGRHFNDAAELAKQNSGLDIGIHLCLSEEKPILAKEKIPSLVNKEGYFFKSHGSFIFNYFFGKIKLGDIERELEAQIKKVLNSGLQPTHIDSHGYIHMLPRVLTIVIRLARKYNIKAIRYPFQRDGINPLGFHHDCRDSTLCCPYKAGFHRYMHFCFLNLFCLSAKFNQGYQDFIKTDYSLGFIDSGQLSVESVRKELAIIDRGIAELICHPGEYAEENRLYKHWGYDWQRELETLTSSGIKKIIEKLDIELINFKDITEKASLRAPKGRSNHVFEIASALRASQ